MSIMWRSIGSSVKGTVHEENGTECQDAFLFSEFNDATKNPVFVATVSDGAGSAPCSRTGAKLVCRKFGKFIESLLTEVLEVSKIREDHIFEFVEDYQRNIQRYATRYKVDFQDFASTFIAVILGKNSSVFVQIGDGGIVRSKNTSPRNYECNSWPQQGEYVNETIFITSSKWRNHLYFENSNTRFDQVALFTDGIQSLVLDFELKKPHSPFFYPWFEWFSSNQNDEKDLSNAIERFLDSEKVNQKTDDDKTLVLIERLS